MFYALHFISLMFYSVNIKKKIYVVNYFKIIVEWKQSTYECK